MIDAGGERSGEPDSQSTGDEFLATLGHELANPLAAVRHALAILRRVGFSDPTLHWAVELTERQVEHMTRLVRAFLDVGRLNHGQIRLDKQRVFVADVIRRVLSRVVLSRFGPSRRVPVVSPCGRCIHARSPGDEMSGFFLPSAADG